jgi:hypothetical protein
MLELLVYLELREQLEQLGSLEQLGKRDSLVLKVLLVQLEPLDSRVTRVRQEVRAVQAMLVNRVSLDLLVHPGSLEHQVL